MEQYGKKLFIILGILCLGALASFIVYKISYTHQTSIIKTQEQSLINNYAQKISTETDAYKLTTNGLKQVKNNLAELGLISVTRAVSVEPNYRDAWLAKAACELKMQNTSAALESALKAEKLDPIHPQTYELLKEIYTQIDNKPLAQAAQTKLDFLSKK